VIISYCRGSLPSWSLWSHLRKTLAPIDLVRTGLRHLSAHSIALRLCRVWVNCRANHSGSRLPFFKQHITLTMQIHGVSFDNYL
jgi:hypothetical protein